MMIAVSASCRRSLFDHRLRATTVCSKKILRNNSIHFSRSIFVRTTCHGLKLKQNHAVSLDQPIPHSKSFEKMRFGRQIFRFFSGNAASLTSAEAVPPSSQQKGDQSAKPSAPVPPAEDKQNSNVTKYKRLLKTYGSLALYTYISISLINLGMVYLTLKSGFIDLSAVFFKQGLPESLANASTFVVAYAIHKLMLVPRLAAAAALVPILAQTMKRLDAFRKPKSPPKQ